MRPCQAVYKDLYGRGKTKTSAEATTSSTDAKVQLRVYKTAITSHTSEDV
jgi:hypothetical protein